MKKFSIKLPFFFSPTAINFNREKSSPSLLLPTSIYTKDKQNTQYIELSFIFFTCWGGAESQLSLDPFFQPLTVLSLMSCRIGPSSIVLVLLGLLKWSSWYLSSPHRDRSFALYRTVPLLSRILLFTSWYLAPIGSTLTPLGTTIGSRDTWIIGYANRTANHEETG